MSFRPVSFSASSSISQVAGGFAGALDAVQSGFVQGAAALGSLGLPASGPGDLAGQMAKAREAATEAVAAPVEFMVLTPFQYGVGARKGDRAYLTPETALKVLTRRIADAGATSEDLALVLLIVAAPTHAAMAQALDAFNAVYPIAQLEQIGRRARALANLETDKFVIPHGPGYPAWGKVSPQKDPKGQAVAKSLGGMLAAGEGSAMGSASPAALLASFAQKQASKVADKAAALQALADSMTGGFDAWAGFHVRGAGPAIFRELSKLDPPFDASFKCSALLCWFGKPAQVAYYKESFGL